MTQVSVNRAKRVTSTPRTARPHNYDKKRIGLEFLDSAHPAVREQLAGATDLQTFRRFKSEVQHHLIAPRIPHEEFDNLTTFSVDD